MATLVSGIVRTRITDHRKRLPDDVTERTCTCNHYELFAGPIHRTQYGMRHGFCRRLSAILVRLAFQIELRDLTPLRCVAKGKQRRIELLGGKNRSCGRCFIAGQRTNFGLRLHVHSIVGTVSGRRDRRIEISPLREKRAIQEHSVSFPGDEHPWHFQAGAVHTHRGKRSTTLESF